MMHDSATPRWVLFWLCLVNLGCGRHETAVEADPAEYETGSSAVPAHGRGRPVPGVFASTPVIDLGHIIAEGQTLRREFVLVNRLAQSVRLTGATAAVPCCSRVDSLPVAPLAPDSEATVAVEYRPGWNVGPKRIAFAVATDAAASPTVPLTLVATLYPAWTFERVAGGPAVGVRRSGRMRYRLATHQKGEAGRSLPDAWTAEGPITIVAAEPPIEEQIRDGIVARRREWELETQPREGAGLQRGALALHWPDGRVTREELAWVVEPSVTVSPSGLVTRASTEPTTHTLILRAADRAIRVLEVSGPMLAAPVALPGEPSQLHRLSVVLKSTERDGGPATIRIVTDHPDQPEISVAVITIGSPAREAP